MPKPEFDQPFPLRRRYVRRILPGVLAFVVVLAALSAWSSVRSMRQIYVNLAAERASGIAALARVDIPRQWDAFLAGGLAPGHPDYEAVDKELAKAMSGFRVARIKVYDPRRITLYSNDPAQVGKLEDNPLLLEVLAEGEAGITPVTEPDGVELYEFYVPHRDGDRLLAVFELYEPTSGLNALLLSNALPPALTSGLLLFALVLALTRLVAGAQADIDYRTAEMVSLRKRLESFLSNTAVAAAQGAEADGSMASRRMECTILYSDIRDFTGFSEQNPPETVVGFLNRLLALQIEVLHRHGGDVDKFIGDAVLAWFRGEGAEARALDAAREMLSSLPGDLPRRVGVGVYSGPVISGALGPVDRRDFTIIGDSVNVAARLCSAAGPDEVVVDAATAARAGRDDLSEPESLSVKGRREPLLVRRWKAGA